MSSPKADLHSLLSAILDQQRQQTALMERLVAGTQPVRRPDRRQGMDLTKQAICWAQENECTNQSDVARALGVSRQALSKLTAFVKVIKQARDFGWDSMPNLSETVSTS